MTAQPVVGTNPPAKRTRRIGRSSVLLLGVVLVPTALNIVFNSYGALTVDGALRMAFATVAGQTVAILSAITALVLTVKRGYAWPAIVAFAIITAVVVGLAVSSIAAAGDTLLSRLDSIAQVNELNG
ncbi:hypothetical protein JNB62_12475 [Microbacterium jejuense]|uniref:Uncharacterized protein n=1 Tax=Microbacterium jejuense TaxID=1263637 RepID=A0ABS7HNF1_9MICO|nr:hypothetical protein [Microbacterium jejuense]MBW9094502.1 hypothetical protein [Microbacterium jejuense]